MFCVRAVCGVWRVCKGYTLCRGAIHYLHIIFVFSRLALSVGSHRQYLNTICPLCVKMCLLKVQHTGKSTQFYHIIFPIIICRQILISRLIILILKICNISFKIQFDDLVKPFRIAPTCSAPTIQYLVCPNYFNECYESVPTYPHCSIIITDLLTHINIYGFILDMNRFTHNNIIFVYFCITYNFISSYIVPIKTHYLPQIYPQLLNVLILLIGHDQLRTRFSSMFLVGFAHNNAAP